MKTSYIVIAVVIAVVAIGGVVMLQSNNNSQTPALEEEGGVTYSDEGYSPAEFTIKKGESVTFMNKSSMPMWIASAMHPTHMAYPNTDIKNCGNSAMMSMMFDACSGTAAGSNWMFQFNEAGEWGYHNHLRPSHWGKIIVE